MKLTVFLAKFLGLFLIIESLSMLAQKAAMLELVTSLMQDRPLLFIVEILGVLGGLAMVLGHTVWSGGLLPVIVTIIGWVALIRSVALLFIPHQAMLNLISAINLEQNYYLFAGISLLVGVYLTAAGFARKTS
jgi:hypothetical protein